MHCLTALHCKTCVNLDYKNISVVCTAAHYCNMFSAWMPWDYKVSVRARGCLPFTLLTPLLHIIVSSHFIFLVPSLFYPNCSIAMSILFSHFTSFMHFSVLPLQNVPSSSTATTHVTHVLPSLACLDYTFIFISHIHPFHCLSSPRLFSSSPGFTEGRRENPSNKKGAWGCGKN